MIYYYVNGQARNGDGAYIVVRMTGGEATALADDVIIRRYRDTTAIRMELRAILYVTYDWQAHYSGSGQKCQITTNQQYIANAINWWAANWQRNGWRKGNGDPVANSDLLAAILLAKKFGRLWVRWQRTKESLPLQVARNLIRETLSASVVTDQIPVDEWLFAEEIDG